MLRSPHPPSVRWPVVSRGQQCRLQSKTDPIQRCPPMRSSPEVTSFEAAIMPSQTRHLLKSSQEALQKTRQSAQRVLFVQARTTNTASEGSQTGGPWTSGAEGFWPERERTGGKGGPSERAVRRGPAEGRGRGRQTIRRQVCTSRSDLFGQLA